MSIESLGRLRPLISYKFWAIPGQGQSLRELKQQMRAAGNTVLKVDRKNNRLLMLKREESSDPVWGCRFCYAAGKLIITDNETELNNHADVEHPGWRGK